MRVLIAVLLLAGCASASYAPRHWSSFRDARIDMTTQQVLNGPNRDAPREVLDAYAVCTTDYVLKYTSPEALAVLDAWARQERPMTQAETDAYEAKARQAGAVTIAYNFDDLAGVCPDKVPLFKQYLKP